MFAPETPITTRYRPSARPRGSGTSHHRHAKRRSEEIPISVAPESSIKASSTRELSPAATACASWFRRLSRGLKVSRLYKEDNALVLQARDQVLDALQKALAENRGWTIHFTPSEAYLDDEPVIRPRVQGKDEEETQSAGEEQIPFIFYRDGIRSMRLPADAPRAELEALFDALRGLGGGTGTQDDLVTLLWQANLRAIEIESVPLEQVIYVSSTEGGEPTGPRTDLQRYGDAPAGEEIHAELGQAAGTQALHLDVFDDWELADTAPDPAEAYARLAPAVAPSRERFQAMWQEEAVRDWREEASVVFRQMLALDGGDEMRRALAHSVCTWIGDALHRNALGETLRAVECLREFDPERAFSEEELIRVATDVDHDRLVQYLDQGPDEEHGHFAALAVALGRPALDMAFTVMSKTQETRVRAAATTALTFLCADEPQLLAPYFSESPGEVMVSLVFVLGQIGGPEVLDLLKLAAQHPEPKVRKQVVIALANVPVAVRLPRLLDALDGQDPLLIAAALQILTREKAPKVATAILKRISRPDFEALAEDAQWALFNGLADMADEDCVSGLEEILFRGGLFARRNFARSAAARTLQRIESDRARAALARGGKSFNRAIRHACHDVTREAQ